MKYISAAAIPCMFIFCLVSFVYADENPIPLETQMQDILKKFKDEPAINDVQEAAVKYAEVHPDKIKEWRNAANKKALLPNVSVGLDRYVTDYWHWDSGTNPDTLQKGKDTVSWDITMTWDMGELIWNNDQTSIDTRSKLMVQLVEVSHPEMDRLNIGKHVANIIVDNLTDRKYFMSFFEGIWDDSYPSERTREIRSFLHFTQMRFDYIPTPAYAEWFKKQEFPPVFFEFKEFKDITEATRLVVLGEYAENAPEAETTHIFNCIDAIINFNEWRALLDMDTDRPVPAPSRASRSSA